MGPWAVLKFSSPGSIHDTASFSVPDPLSTPQDPHPRAMLWQSLHLQPVLFLQHCASRCSRSSMAHHFLYSSSSTRRSVIWPVEVWSDLYIGSRGWGLGLLVLTLKLDFFFPSSRSHSDVCNHLTASLRVYSLVRIGFGPPAQQLTWGQVITRYPSSPEPESLQPLKASQTSDPCLLSCSS